MAYLFFDFADDIKRWDADHAIGQPRVILGYHYPTNYAASMARKTLTGAPGPSRGEHVVFGLTGKDLLVRVTPETTPTFVESVLKRPPDHKARLQRGEITPSL